MADAGPDPGNPIGWFLAIIIAFFIFWLFTGGPTRYENDHPEVPPPPPSEIAN